MAKVSTRTIRGQLTSVSSQRTQFKPYGYSLDFSEGVAGDGVYVEIEVPKDTIVSEDVGYVVLDLNGLNAILRTLADSVDKIDREYKQKVGLQ